MTATVQLAQPYTRHDTIIQLILYKHTTHVTLGSTQSYGSYKDAITTIQLVQSQINPKNIRTNKRQHMHACTHYLLVAGTYKHQVTYGHIQ